MTQEKIEDVIAACDKAQADMLRAYHCMQIIKTLGANVNNDRLSDSEFRQFVKNALPDYTEKPHTTK